MFSDPKMARTNRVYVAFLAVLIIAAAFPVQALATRVPKPLGEAIQQRFPQARLRLDGAIETRLGELFIASIVPELAGRNGTVSLIESFPEPKTPDLLVFSDGWCFLRVFKKGSVNSVISANSLPEQLRKLVLSGKLPGDLIVPDQFVLPRSLKPIAGDLSVLTYDDAAPEKALLTGTKPGAGPVHGPVHGLVVATSPKNGSVILLDEHSLAKQAEYPTVGIPTGLAAANGKVYVTDQAKSCVLVFDLKRKQFVASIQLSARSAPKGLAILPNGKLLYASESAANDIATIETSTDRVLVRTRCPAGPARMAVTPDGFHLIVLNPPAGQATILSTLNQRVVASVNVGSMPNGIVISSDSARAYVSNRMSNTVSVIDIAQHKVVGTLKTGMGPTGVALSSDGSKLYVANAKDNTIGVYDLKTKQAPQEVKLPLDVDFPGALSLLPGGKELAVSSESTDTIGILDLTKLEFSSQPVIGQTSDELLYVQLSD